MFVYAIINGGEGDASVGFDPSLSEGLFEDSFSLVPLGLEVLNG